LKEYSTMKPYNFILLIFIITVSSSFIKINTKLRIKEMDFALYNDPFRSRGFNMENETNRNVSIDTTIMD
jgi:hypothetical protein